MGKSTISMVIFNSYVKLPEGTNFMDEPWMNRLLNGEGNLFFAGQNTGFCPAKCGVFWQKKPSTTSGH